MILTLGDIHGNFEYLMKLLYKYQITDCTIIQVGDFGIGFSNEENDRRILVELNKKLKKISVTLLAIRGNHDDPKFFDGSFKFSNLHLIPDYTVLDLEGHKILCIGGAISIDRNPRKQNDMKGARYGSSKRSYWYDEGVVLNEDFIKQVRDIDILVTHTAPHFCEPLNKNGFGPLVEEFAYNDYSLLDELVKERETMTKIFQELVKNNDIKRHYYGHFHRSQNFTIGNCNHTLLGINELVEIK